MTLYKYIVTEIAKRYKLPDSKQAKNEFLASKFEALSNTQFATYIDEWHNREHK